MGTFEKQTLVGKPLGSPYGLPNAMSIRYRSYIPLNRYIPLNVFAMLIRITYNKTITVLLYALRRRRRNAFASYSKEINIII